MLLMGVVHNVVVISLCYVHPVCPHTCSLKFSFKVMQKLILAVCALVSLPFETVQHKLYSLSTLLFSS